MINTTAEDTNNYKSTFQSSAEAKKNDEEYKKEQLNGEEKEVDSSPKRERKLDENSDSQVPPGSPDRTPVKEPERNEESPKGDPIPLEKKKPRL